MNPVMPFSVQLWVISLNNNWLIVQECMATWVAMEATISGPTNML
jgi:hypothetical protein